VPKGNDKSFLYFEFSRFILQDNLQGIINKSVKKIIKINQNIEESDEVVYVNVDENNKISLSLNKYEVFFKNE
jgi:hypothetical protein